MFRTSAAAGLIACLTCLSSVARAAEPHVTNDAYDTRFYGAIQETEAVSDSVIAEQRQSLTRKTMYAGFGPQSPRDIDMLHGNNQRVFVAAPPASEMNLCNIHFHKNAEHRGGEFTTYAGNGDGHGFGTGYRYSGQLEEAERAPLPSPVANGEHGTLDPGDTIEVHYVYSTAEVKPGPTLGACMNDAIKNPQLRVEAQVYVLVNSVDALDFFDLTLHRTVDGRFQALGIPDTTGAPVQYAGSTTGPSYNEEGSPYQVTWSVRPRVAKVNIQSVAAWLGHNVFEEDHAHGVRNLVLNPDLLSPIH